MGHVEIVMYWDRGVQYSSGTGGTIQKWDRVDRGTGGIVEAAAAGEGTSGAAAATHIHKIPGLCTLYTLQFTIYNIHFTLHTLHHTLYTLHRGRTLHTVHSALLMLTVH